MEGAQRSLRLMRVGSASAKSSSRLKQSAHGLQLPCGLSRSAVVYRAFRMVNGAQGSQARTGSAKRFTLAVGGQLLTRRATCRNVPRKRVIHMRSGCGDSTRQSF